jgi:hypothetical protein
LEPCRQAQPVIKLRDFLKCRRGNNSTVVNSSHRSSHRSRQPARGLDGGTNIAPVCRTTERPQTIGSRIPFLLVVHFIGIRSLGVRSHARSHEQRQPWCCSTYLDWSAIKVPAPSWRPSPARFSEKRSYFTSIKTPSWRPYRRCRSRLWTDQ